MIFEIVIDCCQVCDCMPHAVGTVGITYLRILVHTCVYIRERQSYEMFCPGALIESQFSRLHFKGTDVLTLADQACSGKISQSYSFL